MALQSKGISSQITSAPHEKGTHPYLPYLFLIFYLDGAVFLGIDGLKALKSINENVYQKVLQHGQGIGVLEFKNQKGEISSRIMVTFFPIYLT